MSDIKPDEVVEKPVEDTVENVTEETAGSAAEAAPVDAEVDTAAEEVIELDPIADLQAQLAAAQAKADENWDIALRTKAEMENVKRRTDKDVDNARKFALEKFANELLAVRDSMEMGLTAAQEEGADIAKIIEGTELTGKMLASAMEKFKVVQLDPMGETFNPDHHQAISMQPSPEQENNTVMAVMQKGYLLNDRLLRPAMVVVVKN
jgi:molecular chaperone GrpE